MKVFTKLFLTFIMLCFASVMNATDATIIDWVAGEQGYSNSQDLDGVEITLDTKTTMTCAKGTGSNGPKYYTSGSAVRTYGGNVITFKGLDNEIAHNSSVADIHSRAIGVKYPHYFDVYFMLPVIIKEQGLCHTLSLIITGSDPYGIDTAPVILSLGVTLRIAVNL